MALLYLSTKSDRTASVREIAAHRGLPEPLLSKVMQSLKGNLFVLPVYGNHGGYRLNKELSEISLLKLNESLVGPVQVATCLEPGREVCPMKQGCTIVSPMTLLNQKIVQLFQDTTLETLTRTGNPAPVERTLGLAQ